MNRCRRKPDSRSQRRAGRDDRGGPPDVIIAEDAPPCDHFLTRTRVFLNQQGLAPELVVPWLNEHGGYCVCEVPGNVHDEVGDLIGWHLGEEY
ncbi:MAG: DUF2695 domain-containing protein [Alcanivorax sp.]|nr:DUF2695 domain-containing protein [Alloalcanivorax xenomutans]MBA4721539.1 DUF2695 domain-containing protein [Alcanivorax sp.]PHS60548.1 MAG: DUF2695 domain-containing protein [Alcanivorax sp.]